MQLLLGSVPRASLFPRYAADGFKGQLISAVFDTRISAGQAGRHDFNGARLQLTTGTAFGGGWPPFDVFQTEATKKKPNTLAGSRILTLAVSSAFSSNQNDTNSNEAM